MSGPSLATPPQVNRVLDMSLEIGGGPAFIFLIGAGGSGKSTLADSFVNAVENNQLALAKFDDNQRWQMPRWEDHVAEFDTVAACQAHFVRTWVQKVSEEYSRKKLVICDVNTDPMNIVAAAKELGISRFQSVLVQPSEETRITRLANDETRKHMPREALRAQMEDSFARFLEQRSAELALPHIPNEDKALSVQQLATQSIRILRGSAENAV